MADQSHNPGQAGAAPVPRTGPVPNSASTFGLPVAIALIMGSIIGVGVFNLPTALASLGPVTLVSMALTTMGAIAFALLFGALARRLPADGGPYAYSRAAFGNKVGFFNAWSYWISAWAGNAGIAVGWVLYVEEFVNKDHNRLFSVLLVLVGLWVPALINLSGVKNMGVVQMWTTVLKFAALAFMSVVGLFFIKSANFTPWNVSGESALRAIGGGMAIALFSYIGVEVASVAAGRVRDPDRNVPRATVLGTIACAVVYMLSLVAVFGIVPSETLAASNAPFSVAVNEMFGGTWAGYLMSAVVIISGFGALNGWTMIVAEMPYAAAKDGLFPDQFKRMSKAGVPVYGVVVSTLLASVAMAINYLGSGGATVFTTLVLMTGITVAIPFAFSAAAQIKWRLMDRRSGNGYRFARDVLVAGVALIFSILFIWYSRNTGQSLFVYWAPFLLAGFALLLGVPIYLAQRNKMTEPEPVLPVR